MNTTERKCAWCHGTPATVPGMTFERDDRNCPCNHCKSLLSKRHGASGQAAGQDAPAFVRVRPQRRNGKDRRD